MAKRMHARARRWQRGVSFGSAGRLGAHSAGFEPAENGYLTYQTLGPTFMLLRPDRLVIGSLQLPPKYTVAEKTHSWTLRVAKYRAPAAGGCPGVNLSVLCSVLSPAMCFASDTDRILRWRWQVKASPQWCAFPSGKGIKIAHYSRGYPLRRSDAAASRRFQFGRYQRDAAPPPGRLPWTGKWVLTFDPARGAIVPVLWVFGGARPRRIDVTSYEYMDFHFPRPFGRVYAMPMYGAAEIDQAALADLRNGKGLARLRRWGDFWAAALAGMPDEIDEHFRIDESAGTIEVRDVGRRLDGRRPTVCPVPPFLSAARAGRYPITISGRQLPAPALPGRPRDLYTHYGPCRLVAGRELRYTIPLCPYLDRVLSPVRVTGDRRAAALTKRLRAYFDDAKFTYGGDGDYDPDTLLDILHNLRVLAWAAWSLPDDQRRPAQAAIVRRFARLFNKRSYLYRREPTTGRLFARDRRIFDQFGEVTYDFDWYSGMNLAGLFAGVYFGAISADFVRRRWSLVSDIAAYFEIFQDWATMVPWTDPRGELLNIDCCRHGIQGMIGLARLAERFGLARQRDLARLIASRYMVFLAAEHTLPELYESGGVPVTPWGRGGGSMTLGFGGLHERDLRPSSVHSGVRNPYTLSPLNPEHMLFLRDYGPVEKLQRYEAEVLDKELPGWDVDPARVYFKGQRRGSIEHNAGAYHFYMMDPHLFLRMLVLDWPSRKAIGKARELSGQVIATALVADAPKVLCPNAVAFAGTEWDARRRVLTIRADAGRAVRASWEVLWPERPVEVEGPGGARHRFSGGRLTLSAPCRGRVEWRVRYA